MNNIQDLIRNPARNSIQKSVEYLVWVSVRNPVYDSIYGLVRVSVWGSVEDSVRKKYKWINLKFKN